MQAGEKGGVSLWKKASRERREDITAVVTFRPGEHCFSVGGAQAWYTVAVFVSGVQGTTAPFATTQRNLLFYRGFS